MTQTPSAQSPASRSAIGRKVAIVAVLVLAVAATLIAKAHKTGETQQATEVAKQSHQAQAALPSGPQTTPAQQQPLPSLIDLGAGKCIPCKMMMPILDQLKIDFEDQLNVQVIDAWEDKAAAEHYNVMVIPTQIFLDAQGKELFRHEGFFSREEILAQWQTLGVTLTAPAQDPSSQEKAGE